MPSPDLAALIRWPNVPACYGWLSLDRRGRWRLQGEPVTHRGFVEFINRQYGCDDAGNWFLQNGPQRVYAQLEYTPWVIQRVDDGKLQTHTGYRINDLRALLMDEDGLLLIVFEEGIGVLDDRDLTATLPEILDASGNPASDELLLRYIAHPAEDGGSPLTWRGLPIRKEKRAALATRFGFRPDPQPPEA